MRFLEIKSFKYITLFVFALLCSVVVTVLFTSNSTSDSYIYDEQINSGIENTIIIGSSVVLISTLISLPLAIFNVFFEYRFKQLIHVLTFLPMAIPAYILAYKYTVLLSYGGDFDFINYNFNVLNKSIFFYSIALYPYSYMLIRSALKKIPYNIIESAKTLDKSFVLTIVKIVIPLASKSIIAGAILILAEVFSDIGVVEYFNIVTISTMIKQIYVVNGNYELAISLGLKFALVLIALFIAEHFVLYKMSYSTKYKPIKPVKVKNLTKFVFYTLFSILVSVGFLIPVFYMIKWSFQSYSIIDFGNYLFALKNTAILSAAALVIIIVFSILISHMNKFNQKLRFIYNIFNIWYIMPSTLIALMLIIYFSKINSLLGTAIYSSTTILLLIIAYVMKYSPVAINAISKSYYQVNKKVIESAATMKKSRLKIFFEIDIPLLSRGLFAAMLIVLTDLIKELTLVYTLRPFNFETLTTIAASYAKKDEMVQESSIYSLTIVALCTICVIILTRKESKK